MLIQQRFSKAPQRWPVDKPDRSWCCRIFLKTLSVLFCQLYFVCCLLSCFCACLVWCWFNRSFWRLLSGGHDNQDIYCQGLFNTAVSCLLSVVSCIVSALVLSGVDSECSSAVAGRQTRQIRLLCRSSMQQGVNKMHSDISIKQPKRKNNTFDKSDVMDLTIWVFVKTKNM